jgi:aryl-alcohol dehydrogenase-like predicted oxidoreductase
MDHRLLGHSDLRVSALGLGCNNFGIRLDREGTRRVVHAALDAGVTMFDTADIYGGRGGSETLLGEALGARRKDIVLVSKFGVAMDDEGRLAGGSRRYVTSAVEASLKRLRTEWIDLYYLHRPDPATPIEETLRALDDLVRHGKVRAVACSNLSAQQVAEAERTARTHGLHRFVACQDQYNLLSRDIEADLIPAIQACGLSLVPYFPLASGMLTGKYRLGAPLPQGTRLSNPRYSDRFLNETNLRMVEELHAFCAARGRSLLELAFGWLLSKPFVASVIAGASTPAQLAQNAAALSWRLDAAEMAEVERITRNALAR